MISHPNSFTKESAPLSLRRWWFSLYPLLSATSKRGLLAATLGAAMLFQSIGMKDSPAHTQSPYDNPAVQNALHQLGLLELAGPIGSQFQVNTYTTNWQNLPAVAMDGDGDFVVAWNSFGSDGTDTHYYSVQAQRYNAAGLPQGAQFQVNTYTTESQSLAAAAMDSAGNFVIVWTSLGSSGTDNDANSIQGQRYNAAGVPQGGEFQVNSYTTDRQFRPAVAMDIGGQFVVTWISEGSNGTDTHQFSIQGQRYNAAGTAQGVQFQVNNYTTSDQFSPAVAMDSDGDFVISWDSNGSYSDNSFHSVQARRYNSSGAPQGNEFQVNSYTTDEQRFPSVSQDEDGDFVIVWTSYGSSGGDSSSYSIQGQRYNSTGTPQGSEFQVNSYTTGAQFGAVVAMDSDGDFVVVWNSAGSSGSDASLASIQGQQFDAAGTPQGSQFQVNSYTTNSQYGPTVALDNDGDFVITWHSDGSNYGDTDDNSIQGQRFTAASGPEFQVNSYTTSDQVRANVAMDSDGDFVVVWDSFGSYDSDTHILSIQGQRYNSNGIPVGEQFQVNTYTTNYQAYPAVAMDSDGDFVVFWESFGASTGDTSYGSIQGQRYNSAGVPQGDQFQANTFTLDHQTFPSVAMDTGGDFVVVWQSVYNIQGQRYNALGVPQGSEFQVNTYTTNSQAHPAIAMDSEGDFIVVWDSVGSYQDDNSFHSIQGQRYNSSGTPDGTQFQVNTYTTNDQIRPAITIDSDGDFVVVWDSLGSDGDDSLSSIQGQRYNSAGTTQGSQFQVNTYTTSAQSNPVVIDDVAGGFVVAWDSQGSGGSDTQQISIQGRRYDSAGTPQGDQFQINGYTTNSQAFPAMALGGNGDFVIAWQSNGSHNGDSSQYSIQAQHFYSTGPTPTLTPTNTPSPTPTNTPTPTPTPTSTPDSQNLYLPAVVSDSSP
jgi:hypothetical protein